VTLHADALASLERWTPPSSDQLALRGRFVAHLRERPDGMTRASFPDHVTAGTLVLSADLDHVLLNLHRKARRWFAFGGHCESGDRTLLDAATREAAEESGIVGLEVHPVPVHLDEHVVDFCDPRGPVSHLDVRFTGRAAPDAVHEVSGESLDVRWWPVGDLPELEDEMHTLIRLSRARWSERVSRPPG
jgi:8-oxo-dGTP pyrophosphatase MutT (NUDIX family)